MGKSAWSWLAGIVALVALAAGGFVLLGEGPAGENVDGASEARSPGGAASPEAAPVVRVVKTPTCGCCAGWVAHMRENGFRVEARDMSAGELVAMKREKGVPPDLMSCHTAMAGDYVVEGHVPAADVRRLLEEEPEVAGLAVPGMPVGSPGMEGPNPEAYDVVAFDGEGGRSVFARHEP